MPLSPLELKALKHILEVGHRLESLWPSSSRDAEDSVASLNSGRSSVEVRSKVLSELVSLIAALTTSESESLKRLSIHARNLTADMTAKHLAGILVPFERLLGRALRDDEFIVIQEGDEQEKQVPTAPLRILIDNLRSAFNVGAIFRTAECFAAEEVILSGYTPTPENEKTAKTSLGTQDSIAWSSVAESSFAIEKAKAEGYEIVALETAENAVLLEDFEWPEKALLMLGNERFGLDDKALQSADHFVRIPLFGRKNSLNVGIACGIALADWREKLTARETGNGITYEPIGIFKSDSVHRFEAPRQGVVDRSAQEAVIKLDSKFAPGLKDLEGFERIWVVYDFHHNKNWKPLVRPPRGSHEKRGVFATRSPYRPNSIGLSCVELVRIEANKVFVRGFDLLDGTPILDLKPYIPYADSFPNSATGWLEGVEEEKFNVSFDREAYEDLQWLNERGVTQLEGFLISQLEFDPIDSERKRVAVLEETSVQPTSRTEHSAPTYRIAYRTWRADFRIKDKTVVVTRISSGYSAEDLNASSSGYDDKYADKEIHRAFLATR
jgi:tRNA (adenine37-N6)-methyltransferase